MNRRISTRDGQLADRIKSRLIELRKTPRGASLEAGLGASSIRNILEGRSQSPRLDTLLSIAKILDVDLEWLTDKAVKLNASTLPASTHFDDDTDFFSSQANPPGTMPVYQSQIKDDTMLLRRSPIFMGKPPYSNFEYRGYAVLLTGDTMSPAYNEGDIILVNQDLDITEGHDYLLYLTDKGNVKNFRAAIFARLDRRDDKYFIVTQYNKSNQIEIPAEMVDVIHAIAGKDHRTV